MAQPKTCHSSAARGLSEYETSFFGASYQTVVLQTPLAPAACSIDCIDLRRPVMEELAVG